MAMFLAIGYGDEAGYLATDTAVRDAAHAHDARLRDQGVRMGTAGTPVQVRNHGGAGATTSDGPFMTADLPVAGFSLLEAASLEGGRRHGRQHPLRGGPGRGGGLADAGLTAGGVPGPDGVARRLWRCSPATSPCRAAASSPSCPSWWCSSPR